MIQYTLERRRAVGGTGLDGGSGADAGDCGEGGSTIRVGTGMEGFSTTWSGRVVCTGGALTF